MPDDVQETPETASPSAGLSPQAKIVVVAVVALLFGFVLVSRGFDGAPQGGSTAEQGGQTAVGEDPVQALDVAIAAGKPIYVLFHSQSCASCLDMEQAALRLLPEYDGELTYVDVLTNHPRARELIQRYPFQYIPTSFFLDENGEVVDQYTGTLDDEEMRGRLDALVAASESDQPAEQ
jgi:thiol-disulfide isomerase/thioredoxin